MPNVEIHGQDLEVAIATQARIRKHLHHQQIGKYWKVTIVPDRCLEVAHSEHAPFLRIFVTQDDDLDAVLQVVNSCPFLDAHQAFNIEVMQLYASYPRKK